MDPGIIDLNFLRMVQLGIDYITKDLMDYLKGYHDPNKKSEADDTAAEIQENGSKRVYGIALHLLAQKIKALCFCQFLNRLSSW
jgi:hypothetical protein